MRYTRWIAVGAVVAAVGIASTCGQAIGAGRARDGADGGAQAAGRSESADRRAAAELSRVLPVGKLPADVRLGPTRTLGGYHP